MKKQILLFIAIVSAVAVCGNLQAQTSEKTKKSKTISPAQAVANSAITNPDILVISGKILDATNKQPVKNARLNFDKFGDEIVQASIDEKGNYALALNKNELGEPIRIAFKINGYKRYIIKNIDKGSTFIDANILLQPIETEEKSTAVVRYVMNEDPFNPLVIKME